MDMNNGYELNWDSEIENDSPDFILLPDGEYTFTVERFERGRYEGGEKLPACNKATLYLKIDTDDGEATIRKDLFLHSKCEGTLCAFFACIGQRKHGQRVSMNWGAVTGSVGRARIGHREYNGKTYNEIKRFLEPEDRSQPTSKSNYQQQTLPQQNSYQGYQPGKF